LYYDKLSKDLDNYNFKFFIYLADEKGNRLLSNDIELPMNSIPFYIDNKRIGVSIYNNSVLKIIWYDLTL
jgi:hypothetical protein